MKLQAIDELSDKVTYTVDGEVEDPSGGEAEKNFSIDLTYTVTNNRVIQRVNSDMMMENQFSEIELIKLPLSEGNKWTQTQENREGEEITLASTIDSVDHDGEQKVYTVTYKDRDSDYYEKREIKEGVGMLSFEHLYMFGNDESMPMGYEVNYEKKGYLGD